LDHPWWGERGKETTVAWAVRQKERYLAFRAVHRAIEVGALEARGELRDEEARREAIGGVDQEVNLPHLALPYWRELL
jgi:hypothetical protein